MPVYTTPSGGNPFPALPTGLPAWQALYLARVEDAGTHSNVAYAARLSAQRRDTLLQSIGVSLQDLYNPEIGVSFPSPLIQPDLNAQQINPAQFNNQLTFPNLLYPTAFLGNSAVNPNLTDLPNGEIGNAQAPYDPSQCNPFTGEGCQVTPLGQSLDNFLTANITPTLKKIGLLVLALILFGFGLYFLAKSTDTGKAAIKLASKI